MAASARDKACRVATKQIIYYAFTAKVIGTPIITLLITTPNSRIIFNLSYSNAINKNIINVLFFLKIVVHIIIFHIAGIVHFDLLNK